MCRTSAVLLQMYLLLMYELSTVYCVLSHLEIFAHRGENYGVRLDDPALC